MALVTSGRMSLATLPVAVVLAALTFAPVTTVTDVARDLSLAAAAAGDDRLDTEFADEAAVIVVVIAVS